MPRGDGKKAAEASKSGKLQAYIQPKGGNENMGGGAAYVSWMDVDPQLIVGAVWAANKEGGALLLGHSRDKSSYSVKVYSGGDGTAYYFPYTDDGIAKLEDFLRGLYEIGTGER